MSTQPIPLPISSTSSATDLETSATSGDVHAQMFLALAFHHGGVGYPKDRAQAMAWALCAAQGGHSEAMVLLGNLLAKEGRKAKAGEGLSPQSAQAALWFLKAHEQGNSSAMNLLRDLFLEATRSNLLPSPSVLAAQWLLSAYQYRQPLPGEYGDKSPLSQLRKLLEDAAQVQPWAVQASGAHFLDEVQMSLISNVVRLPWKLDGEGRWEKGCAVFELRIPKAVGLRCPFCMDVVPVVREEVDWWSHSAYKGHPVVLKIHRPVAHCYAHGQVPVVLPRGLAAEGFAKPKNSVTD